MPPKAAGKRPAAPPANVATIMAPVKRLRSDMGSSASTKKTLEEVGITGVTKEVKALDRAAVRANIEQICMQAVATIMRGEGFTYTMPARTATNQLYVPELDRLVLKDKVLTRIFGSASSVRKTAITTRILQLVHELCGKGIHLRLQGMPLDREHLSRLHQFSLLLFKLEVESLKLRFQRSNVLLFCSHGLHQRLLLSFKMLHAQAPCLGVGCASLCLSLESTDLLLLHVDSMHHALLHALHFLEANVVS